MRELIEKMEEKALLAEGYTHYWKYKGFDDKEWKELVAETKKIIQAATKARVKLAGPNGSGSPVITSSMISLNGKDPKDYETFTLTKDGKSDFTKTDRLPYDRVVVSILAAAKKINKDFNPSSDGGPKAIKRVY